MKRYKYTIKASPTHDVVFFSDKHPTQEEIHEKAGLHYDPANFEVMVEELPIERPHRLGYYGTAHFYGLASAKKESAK